MLKMEHNKEHFVTCYFIALIRKQRLPEAHQFIAETYFKFASLVKTCEYWFRRFKSGDFGLKDKEVKTV